MYMIGRVTGMAKDAGKGLVLVETSGGVGYMIGVTAATKTRCSGKKTVPCRHTPWYETTVLNYSAF